MRLLIVQLSDIHLATDSDPVLSRVSQIARAAVSLDPSVTACLLVVTGDITQSGQADEFLLAELFLDDLTTALTKARPGLLVREAFVPGNHDCCLPDKARLREHTVSGLLDRPPTPDDADDSLVRDCLGVQDAFFEFVDRRESMVGRHDHEEWDRRLFQQGVIAFGVDTVHVRLFNTAWMSVKRQPQGRLLAPTWVGAPTLEASSLVVTLFHHPYTWLQAGNGREFRRQVDRYSDIVMTGHDHLGDQYSKQTLHGDRCLYLEGEVLQDRDSSANSAFNVVLVDLDTKCLQTAVLRWQHDHYHTESRTDWQPYVRGHSVQGGIFEFTEGFGSWLEDVGVALSHPRVAKVRLQDIFVHPDCRDCSYTEDPAGRPATVRGAQFLDYVHEHRHILVLGEEKSGRTSLAKRLNDGLLRDRVVPVLITGADIKTPAVDALHRLVRASIEEQYGEHSVEPYLQLDHGSRALIVDDLDASGLNRKAINAFLEAADQLFHITVAFVDRSFTQRELSAHGDEHMALLSYRHLVLRPLGHRLRRELICRWHAMGEDFTTNELDTAREIADAERQINVLLGQNLLPSYPVWVLILLQSIEVQGVHTTASGAYGHHYEALITMACQRALDKKTNRRTSILLGTVYAYTSWVGHRMFSMGRPSLTEKELADATHEYKRVRKISFSPEIMQSVLEEARVLRRDVDGTYSFVYPYLRYYFIARHISSELRTSTHGEAMRAEVRHMTQHLHVEEYANIVIFLMYLTKDERIIGDVLDHSRRLYSGYEASDLDSDVEFAGRLSGEPLPLLLDGARARQYTEQDRDHLDQITDQAESSPSDPGSGERSEDAQLDEVMRVNSALKTLQIMGQILCDNPGDLEGELKVQVAQECFLLGLRTLRQLFSVMDESLPELRTMFAEMFRKLRHLEDERELAITTDNWLFWLAFGSSYGMLKRISQAVGSVYLEDTYSEIHIPRSPIALELIKLAIKLDHFPEFPKAAVADAQALVVKRVRNQRGWEVKKPFAFRLLQHLVRDHFYLYPEPPQIRQSTCARLGIVHNEPGMLTSADRHIRRLN